MQSLVYAILRQNPKNSEAFRAIQSKGRTWTQRAVGCCVWVVAKEADRVSQNENK